MLEGVDAVLPCSLPESVEFVLSTALIYLSSVVVLAASFVTNALKDTTAVTSIFNPVPN